MLGPRAREALALARDGLTMNTIAERMGVSAETVRKHLYRARIALRARNTTHAVAIALREKLIPFPQEDTHAAVD